MSWQAYRLMFKLESPLHIGWRKTGNLMQTRYYVPGRIFWGAVTASLTRCLGKKNYQQVGDWVRDNLRFGYFFLAKDLNNPLYPTYSKGNIKYGYDKTLSEPEFERQFLSSIASTSIDADVFASQEGSLHEVEFIIPTLDTGRSVYLVGHLFVRVQNYDEFSLTNPVISVIFEDNDVKLQEHSLCQKIVPTLQIGGERSYGFGRLKLCQNGCKMTNKLFGYDLDKENLSVTVDKQKSLFAHAIANDKSVSGTIEPLVSKEWAKNLGPGRSISLLGLCYTPGSVVIKETSFMIGHYGIWE